jgi:DNA polymerase (family X)
MSTTPPIRLSNRQISDVFTLIANLLEIKGENIYKILAYRRAADSLIGNPREIYDIWQSNELHTLPGVGKAIAEKIDELLKTGRLEYLEKLKEEIPASLTDLLKIPDVGPKKAALFWREAGISNLAELEAAAREGKLRHLPGVGLKTENRIIAGIEALSRRSNRTPLGVAYPFAQTLVDWLMTLPGVEQANLAGSLRRMQTTIGDIDLTAATSKPARVMDAFIHHPQVTNVFSQGDTKSSVEFHNGLRAQLWLHPPEQYGTALVYATGSKNHNVRLRELAVERGLSLSDKSIIQPDRVESFIATEAEVYSSLGMPWIPPELREDRGEIQSALKGFLPELIEIEHITSELHTHSTWSDGQKSILEMAEAALECGYKVLAITDHTSGLGVVRGVSADNIDAQKREIDEVQKRMGDRLRILHGAEVEIRSDGTLDFSDDVLARLDIVIASLHSGLRQPREQVTQRLIKVIRNRHVDIIAHPTGRLIPDREGADLDMDAVLAAASESGVALEINAHPARLDLEDIYARRAVELGIPISINTDAHHPDQFNMIRFGVAVARRGWIGPKDVINTWESNHLMSWLYERILPPSAP